MFGLNPFLNLLADENGYDQSVLMAIAFGPLVLAAILFSLGVKLQHAGKPSWLKWLALVPLAVGLIMGIAPAQWYFGDPLQARYVGGTWKKSVFYAAGVFMPILGAIGLVVWNKIVAGQKYDEL